MLLTGEDSSAIEAVLTRNTPQGSSFVKAIILGAGQGKRLLPLTADVPKALLDIGGVPLIERQIRALSKAGIQDFAVVTGYGSAKMEEALESVGRSQRVSIRTVFNPFYLVADNLASCWIARAEMNGDFIQVNGDNVFRADLVENLLANASDLATVAISRKPRYDADDMKIMLDGERLTEIGKSLPVESVDAEAIGFYVFKGPSVDSYRKVLDQAIQEPQGLRHWFPFAVGRLAKIVNVTVCDVSRFQWCEVDYPVDLQQARQMVSDW